LGGDSPTRKKGGTSIGKRDWMRNKNLTGGKFKSEEGLSQKMRKGSFARKRGADNDSEKNPEKAKRARKKTSEKSENVVRS